MVPVEEVLEGFQSSVQTGIHRSRPESGGLDSVPPRLADKGFFDMRQTHQWGMRWLKNCGDDFCLRRCESTHASPLLLTSTESVKGTATQ